MLGDIIDSFTIDFSEFQPQDFKSWVKVIGEISYELILYTINVLASCYFIRQYIPIRSKIVSFVLSLFFSTMHLNLQAVLSNLHLPVLEQQDLIILFLPIWILFNFTPFDIIFKIFRLFRPILGFFGGYVIGQAVVNFTDTADSKYPADFFLISITVIGCSMAQYFLVLLYFKATKPKEAKCFNIFIILFEVFVAFNAYYWLTDLGHISNTLWFDKKDVKFCVQIAVGVLEFFRYLIPEFVYVAIYKFFESIVAFFIPYYGNTWVPSE